MSGLPLVLGVAAGVAIGSEVRGRSRAAGSLARAAKPAARPIPAEVEPLLDALERVRVAFGLADVGVIPDRKVLVLLGSTRTLAGLVRGGRGTYALRRLGVGSTTMYGRSGGPEISNWGDLSYWLLDAAQDLSGDPSVNDEDWTAVPIPAPGGPDVPWVSVKARAWRPPVSTPRIDPCGLGDVAMPYSGVEVLTVNPKIPPLFAAHGVSVEALDAVVACGGTLWPSCALSWRVSPSYGDVLFLLDVAAVERGFDVRRKAPWMLFATDAYSLRASTLADWADQAAREARGDLSFWGGTWKEMAANRWIQDDLVVERFSDPERVAQEDGSGATSSGVRVKNWRQVQTLIRRLIAHHAPKKDPYATEISGDWADDLHYPYLELKARGRVPLSAYPAVVLARGLAPAVLPRIRAAGFEGRVILADAATTHRREADAARWAADLTRAILAEGRRGFLTTSAWGARIERR